MFVVLIYPWIVFQKEEIEQSQESSKYQILKYNNGLNN